MEIAGAVLSTVKVALGPAAGALFPALSVADVPSQLIGQATLLEQPGGGRMLTLPIDITVVLTEDPIAAGLPVSISLDLTGQVIATNALFVPEPAPAMAWLAALGTLAALRRLRRS